MFKSLVFIVAFISVAECFDWVSWDSSSYDVPSGSFSGGSSYYVIRCNHGGGLLPGHYSSDENYAYVSYNGYEIKCKNFEILTASPDELIWENASSGRSLVIGGRSGSGDQLYVCRFSISGRLIPGKLHNGRCYASYGGKEHSSGNWDTLKVIYG